MNTSRAFFAVPRSYKAELRNYDAVESAGSCRRSSDVQAGIQQTVVVVEKWIKLNNRRMEVERQGKEASVFSSQGELVTGNVHVEGKQFEPRAPGESTLSSSSSVQKQNRAIPRTVCVAMK